jgi:hypothetical protein
MIAAVRREKPAASSAAAGQRVQALASMYGIRAQRLAEALGFTLGNAG